jgi:DNA polymerase III subunit gamma/tau
MQPTPYQVFARKFRPQLFKDVIGQEHITTTLQNAIRKGRIAQSFLFSGSRGVGKTSTARILAKALNCQKGPSETPCDKCASCDEISRGSSLDVLEIDGASNRGIDEIRTLRENVKFKPSHGQFKIYIIDEVHMLTGEAFNALLKTLEEPPEHVKFIFATTEPHKVPLTILSRCQRFHFKRLSTAEIHAKLKDIAKKEKIKANDQTLFLIAKSAEGSLRDGESLLDQMASFSDGEIKEKDIVFSLGLTSNDMYSKFLHAVEEKKADEILRLVHDLVEQGKDLEQFLKGLLECFRDLLILTLKDAEEAWIEQDEDALAELKALSKKFNREELFLILSLLQQALREIRWSRTPRFLAEICLLKIVNRADLKSVQAVLDELKKAPRLFSGSESSPAKQTPAPPPLKIEDKKKEFRSVGAAAKQTAEALEAESEAPDPEETGKALTLNDVERVWPELLTGLKAKRMSIGMFLSEAEPLEVNGKLVVFGFPAEFKFHKETIEQPNNKTFVQDHLRALLKYPADISFVVTQADRTVGIQTPPEAAQDSGLITSALEIFEGSRVIRKT